MNVKIKASIENGSESQRKQKLEKDVLLASKGFITRGILGEGSFSKVKRACSVRLQRELAIKIIRRDQEPETFQEKFLRREMELLSFIKHPRIVKVYEIYETIAPAKVYIVMELLNSGDLLEYIKAKGSVNEKTARVIFMDISRALIYLHERYIAHRDVKCENVLLHKIMSKRTGPTIIAKLCDFGFARQFPVDENTTNEQKNQCMTTTFCGSAAYAPPEILERKRHDPMLSDVWSLGVVLFITLHGAMPFDDSNIREMVMRQKRGDCITFRSEEVSRLAKDLIARILRPNPKQRPIVKMLVRHQWLHEESDASVKSKSRCELAT